VASTAFGRTRAAVRDSETNPGIVKDIARPNESISARTAVARMDRISNTSEPNAMPANPLKNNRSGRTAWPSTDRTCPLMRGLNELRPSRIRRRWYQLSVTTPSNFCRFPQAPCNRTSGTRSVTFCRRARISLGVKGLSISNAMMGDSNGIGFYPSSRSTRDGATIPRCDCAPGRDPYHGAGTTPSQYFAALHGSGCENAWQRLVELAPAIIPLVGTRLRQERDAEMRATFLNIAWQAHPAGAVPLWRDALDDSELAGPVQ
jgi:hypothetical protein